MPAPDPPPCRGDEGGVRELLRKSGLDSGAANALLARNREMPAGNLLARLESRLGAVHSDPKLQRCLMGLASAALVVAAIAQLIGSTA